MRERQLPGNARAADPWSVRSCGLVRPPEGCALLSHQQAEALCRVNRAQPTSRASGVSCTAWLGGKLGLISHSNAVKLLEETCNTTTILCALQKSIFSLILVKFDQKYTKYRLNCATKLHVSRILDKLNLFHIRICRLSKDDDCCFF